MHNDVQFRVPQVLHVSCNICRYSCIDMSALVPVLQLLHKIYMITVQLYKCMHDNNVHVMLYPSG